MSEQQQALADAESEQLAALRAAIQIGIDDIEVGKYEDVDDTHAWVHEIAETVTTQFVAQLAAYRIRTSAAAKADVREALQYSAFRFGTAAMGRYADLIARTLADIRTSPLGTGSHERSDLGEGIHARHLKASDKGSEVNDPRHIAFYRVDGNNVLVLRVLHEARDLPSHLPS